ncbi:MAG TPA: NAD(P)/FAD-dependent oxidoreductase [Alphaproteobacteria bacterium]|nr:NAD(P)/FAD-dependent oxidoreductase [Alphaproteobacteria bacterium]
MPETLDRTSLSASPEQLDLALQAADDRILAAIAYQATGDKHWISDPFKSLLPPVKKVTQSAEQLAESEIPKAGAERQAQEALHTAVKKLLTGTGGSARLSGEHISDELVEFIFGHQMPSSYSSLLRESFAATKSPLTHATDVRIPSIIIIGAGFCGLTMAIRLKELGVPFQLLEKHDEVGGVWHENYYPGCAVDTPTCIYSFASALNPDWSEYHAKRDEILEYIRKTTDRQGICDSLHLNCEVQKMQWSAPEQQWILSVRTPSGMREFRSDIVIAALGTLNQPKYPQIDSIEDFQGPTFHTGRWRADVQLSGRRIGLIGNGSSGFQVGPTLAARASHLTSFQRSPAWTAANPLVDTKVPEQLRWLLREVPGYALWHRFVMYWLTGDKGFENLNRDPEWRGSGISEANERVRAQLIKYIRSQLGGREDLIEKLVPAYPPYTKRMVTDNGWLKSLTRPNVSLVTDTIARATRDGLVTSDGKHHDLDVIIYATGFYGTRFLWPAEVRGRSGRTPAEIAGKNDNIRAYLGMAMPDFPNFFSIFGPNSSIGHGGGATHIAQCQANYIGDCIVQMIGKGVKTVECREEINTDYNRRLDEGLQFKVWSEPGIASRYRNEEGRIVANHPWTLQRFWEMTRTANLDDYEVTAIA